MNEWNNKNKLYNRALSFRIQTAEANREPRSDPANKRTSENFSESHIICVSAFCLINDE